jgi:glycosyl hydrolase family 99
MKRAVLVLVAAAFVLPVGEASAARKRSYSGSYTLTIQTVPALRHVPFLLDGQRLVSDRRGVLHVTASAGLHRLDALQPTALGKGVRARFDRWGDDAFKPTRTVELTGDTSLQVGFDMFYRAHPTFVDLASRPVDPKRITSMTLLSTFGERDRVAPGGSRWLVGSRVARRVDGLERTEIRYAVESVVVDGANIVHRAQQRFYPSRGSAARIRLLLYSARISAHDLLFGTPIGRSILLVYPSGRQQRLALHDGRVFLPALPRGTYGLKVQAPGYSPAVPISISKNQVVAMRVVSYLDFAVIAVGGFVFTVGLVLVRRPRLRARLRGKLVATSAAALLGALVVATPALAATPPSRPIPTFAYYYIWYDHSTWDRAKRDFPELGRYSSDDPVVLRRHVQLAKQAGIAGFIVSWKSTPKLNRRLARLVQAADGERFKLALIYEGLDFYRNPLPPARIARDLRSFAARYARDPAFDLYSKPLVIWSGTWRFTRQQVAWVTQQLRDRLLVLASEKNVAGYARLAPHVDGDAYYWSSVDPDTYPGYQQKLDAMSAAVHAHGGLWIAPAAPGFDARLVGGTRIVARRNGATLRRELTSAFRSSPDLVGLISWNEFSENSELEPTVASGRRYLNVLSGVLDARFTVRGDFDSSEEPTSRIGYGVPFLVGSTVLLVTIVGAALWRREVRKVVERSL